MPRGSALCGKPLRLRPAVSGSNGKAGRRFHRRLSPAIAIEQRSAGANPRSTIATATEIFDYLRVLFSGVGQPHDPTTGQPIHRQTPQQIVDQILAYPAETKIILLAPLLQNSEG